MAQAFTRCGLLPLTRLAASRLGILSPLRGAREETRSARDSKSNSAGALAGAGLREMRVHDAPIVGFLAKDHGRAGVERRPIARRHVLSVEFPQPKPMLAAFIGVAVQVEEHRLGRLAPDRLEFLPIEAGIGVDVVGVQLEDPLAVARGAADEIGLRHALSDSNAGNLAYLGAQFA